VPPPTGSPLFPPQTAPLLPAGDGSPFPRSSAPCNDLFFAFELNIVKPVIVNHISGPAMFPDGTVTTVPVPQASLDWTASPVFEVGKFLPDNLGFVAVNYRFLATTGTGTATTPDGTLGDLRSRLDYNVADFDYGTLPEAIATNTYWSGRFGFRLAQTYFDSLLQNGSRTTEATNWFLGGGAHARFDLEHRFEFLRGLSIFGHIDGAVIIGQVRQHYTEALTEPDGTVLTATGMAHHVETFPMLGLQAGLGYTPSIFQTLHLEAGYAYEEWFRVGHLDSTSSTARLTTNGAFFRVQFDY
jgi:hypothetical protein